MSGMVGEITAGPTWLELGLAQLKISFVGGTHKLTFKIGDGNQEEEVTVVLERMERDDTQKDTSGALILHGYVDEQGRKGMSCIVRYHLPSHTGSVEYVFD